MHLLFMQKLAAYFEFATVSKPTQAPAAKDTNAASAITAYFGRQNFAKID